MTAETTAPPGIRFPAPLVQGQLVRRYKRFLADVRLEDGTTVTAHCPNTGSMLGCQPPGARVWLSQSPGAGRKYPFTWELVELDTGVLVGIHTGRTNRLAEQAIRSGMLGELGHIGMLRAEVPVPEAGARLDFLLHRPGQPDYYLEVKNVTAAQDSRAIFPDAVSERAARHARLLQDLRRAGAGAGILFCVQRADAGTVAPADHIDPAYGRALRAAAAAGVDVLAIGACASPEEIRVDRRIPVLL